MKRPPRKGEGRPTEYATSTLKMALTYLYNLPKDEAVHTIEGLAMYLGVSRETIYAWSKDEAKQEFSDIVSKIRTKKSFTLQNKSLKGEFNPAISKLLLGHEGYRDQQDLTSDGKAIKGNTIILADFTDEASSE